MQIQREPYKTVPTMTQVPQQRFASQASFLFSPDSFQRSVKFGKEFDPASESHLVKDIPLNVLNLTYDSVLLSRIAPELLQDQDLAEKLLQEVPGKKIDSKKAMTMCLGKVLRENPAILDRLAPKIARAFADEARDFTFEIVKKVYSEGTDARGRWITRGNIYNTLMSQNPASIFYWQRGEDGHLEYTAALHQFPEDPETAEIRSVYFDPESQGESLNRKLNIKLITRAKQFGVKTLLTDARPMDVPLLESLGFRTNGQYIESSIWMELDMEGTFYG